MKFMASACCCFLAKEGVRSGLDLTIPEGGLFVFKAAAQRKAARHGICSPGNFKLFHEVDVSATFAVDAASCLVQTRAQQIAWLCCLPALRHGVQDSRRGNTKRRSLGEARGIVQGRKKDGFRPQFFHE